MPEQTARRLATETPEAPPNGQPAPATRPATKKETAGVGVEYKPGEEVITTIETTTKETTKVPGVVSPKNDSQTQTKLSPEQLAKLQRQRYRQASIRLTNLTEWLEFWREVKEIHDERITIDPHLAYTNVAKFKMVITRKSDPHLIPGQNNPFNNSCTADRPLGEWDFTTDINTFIGHLQKINGDSGGRFLVELRDAEGTLISKSWIDDDGDALQGHENASWEGEIPNPFTTHTKTETERPKKEKTAKDFINELREEIEGLKAIGLIPDKQEGGNSLLDSVNATAVATVITKLGDTLASIGEQGSKYTSGGDKGFVRSLAEGEEGQKRIWAGFDNVTMLLHGIASDYLQGRREKAKREFELEKIKLMKENPELAKTIQQQSEQEKAKEEDVYDYICRKCEEADKTFDITTDAKVQGMDKGSLTLIRGVLASDDTPETVLDKFIKVCGMRGKGERALKLKDLPQTIGFIERMQRAVKAAAQG